NLTTQAWIGEGASVTADANVAVQAQDVTTVSIVTGSVAISGEVAVGVSGGVSVITKNTESWIAKDAQVTGKAATGEAAFNANTGQFTDSAKVNRAQEVSVTKDFVTSDVQLSGQSPHKFGTQITITNHGFSEGQEVIYSAGSQAIRGLTSGKRYFVH